MRRRSFLREKPTLTVEQFEARHIMGLLSDRQAEKLYREFRQQLLARDRGTGRRSWSWWAIEGPERLVLGTVPGPGHPAGPPVTVLEDELTALVRTGHATPSEVRLLREQVQAWEQSGSPSARLQADHARQVLAELEK
ncbi:hypothetical protein [Rhodothermus marinus]|uniref:Uncharacterized protein n=1 Tax=Rhodothermus marinus (strain ATCC 43812 / DSM 4252 / R-10) TaxID=518766 RepID=D0MHF6_RHOM4|nr:hypothetical protein [Rhodothermus marinus]ACY47914.1 hypothetical protein Rmar_1020 [Rhodothermus marinus DSM 4252]